MIAPNMNVFTCQTDVSVNQYNYASKIESEIWGQGSREGIFGKPLPFLQLFDFYLYFMKLQLNI